MKLNDVIKGIRVRAKVREMEIKSISYNSKESKKGSLFVCVKGTCLDGHDFAKKAYEKGARAFIAERKLKLPRDAEVIEVTDARNALCTVSANFYENPSREMKVFAVVGTNGKTTTAYILESILKEAGLNPGVIGTINYRYSGKVTQAVNTTPESLDIQRMLGEMRSGDVRSAVIEVSSHALHQGRTKKVYFDAGIFTNLTQDHLDYHLNMRNYFFSKRRFFAKSLKEGGKVKNVFAAVNVDDKYGRKLFSEFKSVYRLIPYSMKKCAGVYPLSKKADVNGIRLTVDTPKGVLKINSPLTGEFNIYNILGAVALAVGEGIALGTIKRGVDGLKNVRGRMHKINTDKGCVFVDYAHTPDALLRAIKSVRSLGVKRIITVFGCGGDRDKKKRPKMGAISLKLSDISIVTSDNPRSEEPLGIIKEILKPFSDKPYKDYLCFVDREAAIKEAVSLMRKGDAVLIAGKGHEDYQILKNKRIPFDDVKIVTKHLKRKGIKIIQ